MDKHGIKVNVELNSVSLLMELDTRAGASLISDEIYHKHFSIMLLKPSLTRLQTYKGKSIKVLGKITIGVKYCNQHANLTLVVVEGTGLSLFSRDWFAAIELDWQNIFNLKGSLNFFDT